MWCPTSHNYGCYLSLISTEQLDTLLKFLDRSIGYCENARPTDFDDPEQEPTETYAGATGYARGTMQMVADDLRSLVEQ